MFGLGGLSCRQGSASSARFSVQWFLGAGEGDTQGFILGKHCKEILRGIVRF